MYAKSVCLLVFALTASATIRESAEKTLALIEKTQAQWKIPCASCHHQGLGMMALDSARLHGLKVDEPAARAHVARTITPLLQSVDGALNIPIDALAFGYTMIAASTAGIQPNLVTSVAARKFANAQLPDGRWAAADARPPMSASDFTATALAIRAISSYLPPQLAAGRAARFDRARRWLTTARPRSNEDRAFQLLGLLWSGASAHELRHAAAGLIAAQRRDGGWAQESGMESDAYATGQSLYALNQSRVLAPRADALQRGLRFLLDAQAPDGSWLVKTRLHSPAPISPPFFDAGFPYGRDQFSSFSGTVWAFLALLEALPVVPDPVRPEPPANTEPRDAKPWMETALFDSSTALEDIADPAMLPYVLPDMAKTELLLKRGAKADERAVAIAASYRGSAPVVRLLLEHGAKPSASVLLAAVNGGDVHTVRALLDAGADARFQPQQSDSPLKIAVLSNNLELVRLLVERGAPIDQKDENGMTPLIHAALQHRTAVVRILLDLNADPNVVDTFGYTALRHAGDILYADPETAALLRPVTATR